MQLCWLYLEHLVRFVKDQDAHVLRAEHTLPNPALQRAMRANDNVFVDTRTPVVKSAG